METIIRRRLNTAANVREFCRAHPYENAGYTAAVDALEAGLTRADGVARQETSSRVLGPKLSEMKTELRWSIRRTIRIVRGVAERVESEHPEVALRIRVPAQALNHAQFLTHAQVALTTATEHREMLLQYGLAETDLERLAQSIIQLDVIVKQHQEAKLSHVGARADLREIVDTLHTIVIQLDAINQSRFRDESQLLAQWKSARDVRWPTPKKEADAPPEVGHATPAA